MSRYITISSSDCKDIYPENKGGHFYTILNEELMLDDEWDVGISEFTYNSSGGFPFLTEDDAHMIMRTFEEHPKYTSVKAKEGVYVFTPLIPAKVTVTFVDKNKKEYPFLIVDYAAHDYVLTAPELLNMLAERFGQLAARSNATVTFLKTKIDVNVSKEMPKIKLKFNLELAKVLGVYETYEITKKTSIPINIKDEDVRQPYLDTFQKVKKDTSVSFKIQKIQQTIASLLAFLNAALKASSDEIMSFYENME